MKKRTHWTEEKVENYLFKIGADFVSQVLENVSSKAELAKNLKISKSAVSQTLNNPGNLTLETMIKYARAIGMKVNVVLYDKNKSDRPVHPNIFRECWEQQNQPRDFFDLEQQNQAFAITASGKITKKESRFLYEPSDASSGGVMPTLGNGKVISAASTVDERRLPNG